LKRYSRKSATITAGAAGASLLASQLPTATSPSVARTPANTFRVAAIRFDVFPFPFWSTIVEHDFNRDWWLEPETEVDHQEHDAQAAELAAEQAAELRWEMERGQ
jgi:hypothetical protein